MHLRLQFDQQIALHIEAAADHRGLFADCTVSQ